MTVKIDKVQTENLVYNCIFELWEKKREKLKEHAVTYEEAWKKEKDGEHNKEEAIILLGYVLDDIKSFNKINKMLYGLSVTSHNPGRRRLAKVIWEEIEETEIEIDNLEDALEQLQDADEN